MGSMNIQERLDTVPDEFRREPAVVFALASCVGPMLIVLLALLAGQTDASSPLYTLAAIVFVGAVCGFILTTYRAHRTQRAESEEQEAARAERVEAARAERRVMTRRTLTRR